MDVADQNLYVYTAGFGVWQTQGAWCWCGSNTCSKVELRLSKRAPVI